MIKILILISAIGLGGFFVYNLYIEKPIVQNTELHSAKEDDEDVVTPTIIDTEKNSPEVTTVKSDARTIDLSSGMLTQTPQYIFDEIETQKLDLSHNRLGGSIQAEIRQLQNLKVLNLSNNQFTGVPAEIGQLKNLEILDLSNNNITGLPLELGNLTNLKILNLKGNNYSEFDLRLIKEKLPTSVMIEVD